MTEQACILCARRGRTTKLSQGHCCQPCAQRLHDNITALPELTAMAVASLPPGQGTSTSTAYGSRPPLNVSALDPELALVELNHGDPSSAVTILECAEMWERAIREDRGFAPYGVASEQRADSTTKATLTSVCRFLASQVQWATTEPAFGLEEFADHMHRAVTVLRRWDYTADPAATVIACPTITDQGDCGYRLRYSTMEETVTCRRCGASRDVATLTVVAMSDGRPVWMDPENASRWLGISEATLRRKATRGELVRSHGRYLISSSAAS